MRRTAVGMLLVFAACGGGGGSSEQPAAPTSTVQSTTTIKTATVRQVASIVAMFSTDLRRYAADARTCQIVEDPKCGVAAKINISTLSISAATFDTTLRAAAEDRPNNNLFIGAYPAELVGLVASTRAAIAEVIAAGQTLTKSSCTSSAAASSCSAPFLTMGSAASRLVQQLDAWAPYL